MHTKVDHQGHRYECDRCARFYKHPTSLRTHKQTKHDRQNINSHELSATEYADTTPESAVEMVSPVYLCPISDCVYKCTILDDEQAHHLESSHGIINYQKFIKL